MYKADLLGQLRTRNKTQRDTFKLIVGQYAIVLQTSKELETRVYQLEQDLSNAKRTSLTSPNAGIDRSDGASGSSGGNNLIQNLLEEKLLALQTELTAAYRLKSENSETLLRMKEQAENDEKLILEKEEELKEAKKEIEEEKKRTDAAVLRHQQMEATIEVLRRELMQSRENCESAEQALKKVSEENETLITRLLTLKNSQVELMNLQNDYEELKMQRKENSKLHETKQQTISADALDLSDNSSILDTVAWQSNFNVAIPTTTKRTIRAHRGQVTTCRYNEKGTLLVSGGVDSLIRIIDARSGACKASLKDARASVINVRFSPDTNFVLGTGNEKVARVWSMKDGRCVHTLAGHRQKIYANSFNPDGEQIVTGSHDRTIRIWDLKTGGNLNTINCSSACNSVGVSPNGDMMATAHLDKRVRFWSMRTGEQTHEIKTVHTQQATCAEFSRDGSLVATNGRDNIINIVDVRTYGVLHSLKGTPTTPFINGVNWGRVTFSPDAQYVVAGSETGTVCIWSVSDGEMVNNLTWSGLSQYETPADASSPITTVSCVDWNRNGRQIVSCLNSGYLIIWEDE